MKAKIIVCAVLFHILVAGVCYGLHFVNLKPEPELIPVFEMVQVQQQVEPAPPPPPKQVEPVPQPEPPKPRPDVKPKVEPKVEPKVDKALPPEPKIEEKKPDPPPPEPKPEEVKPDPTPDPEPTPAPPPPPKDDFAIDDVKLPAKHEMPSLKPVGSVDMDPLMQVYLDQLKKIIMDNFRPPSNINVDRSAKTTVQFTIDRMGGISAVTLKNSSGNQTWDQLSVRAVKISKVPPLPPNFRAPSLVLRFNFTPN